MQPSNKFTLRIWEKTPEYQNALMQAQQKQYTLGKQLRTQGFEGALGSIDFDGEDNPRTWLNGLCAATYKHPLSFDLAHKLVKKNGATGYWSFGDFEWLLQGRGKIYDKAMHELGFVANPRTGRWQRGTYVPPGKGKSEPFSPWGEIVSKEWDEYQKMLVLPNTDYHVGTVYRVQSRANGSILAEFAASPFVPTSNILIRQSEEGGHFSRQQNGFTLVGRNIQKSRGNKVADQYVHVTATTPEGRSVERVWPHIVGMRDEHSVFVLADDLVEEVQKLKS